MTLIFHIRISSVQVTKTPVKKFTYQAVLPLTTLGGEQIVMKDDDPTQLMQSVKTWVETTFKPWELSSSYDFNIELV